MKDIWDGLDMADWLKREFEREMVKEPIFDPPAPDELCVFGQPHELDRKTMTCKLCGTPFPKFPEMPALH